jgi:hypothetical protein
MASYAGGAVFHPHDLLRAIISRTASFDLPKVGWKDPAQGGPASIFADLGDGILNIAMVEVEPSLGEGPESDSIKTVFAGWNASNGLPLAAVRMGRLVGI